MSAAYQPPFTISPEIVSLVAQISEDLGRISAVQRSATSLKLRRINRIRTVHGSLAIEGNTLDEDQISAILDGKLVLAPAKEIQEARNALQAYDKVTAWQPHRVADLMAAHKVLMTGLLDAPGQFRRGGVGIMKGQEVLHMAPPAENVPPLVKDLLGWLEHCKDHPLIASSVFHYEFEFIHPFSDGNGRMGRLWQSLILSRWNSLLAFVPVETLVFSHQAEYYAAINQSTSQADSGPFIEFMLRMLQDALQEFVKTSEKKAEKTSDKILRLVATDPSVTIAQLASLAGLSTRTIERNIQALQAQGRLRRVGPDKGGHWEIGH